MKFSIKKKISVTNILFKFWMYPPSLHMSRQRFNIWTPFFVFTWSIKKIWIENKIWNIPVPSKVLRTTINKQPIYRLSLHQTVYKFTNEITMKSNCNLQILSSNSHSSQHSFSGQSLRQWSFHFCIYWK